MKPCEHCAGHSDYCETPCHHYNTLFEQYLVIAYAREVLEVSLESTSVWRKRCQELCQHARHITHYAKSLIQIERILTYQGPDVGLSGWPLWVKDRAEVAVKRHMRGTSRPTA